MKQILAGVILIVISVMGGCREDRFPVESLPQPGPNTNIGDTVYVQQYPNWMGFNHPQAVLVGKEPLIYVADTDNDRIVMLDIAGGVIGYSQPIRRPVALTEDFRLNLLVCAQFDTLLPGHATPTTYGAIYRLDLPSVGHNLALATPRRIFFEPSDSTRRYDGVATLYDNTYYVARSGPKNELIQYDRDNAILLFSKSDSLLSPVTASFQPDGTGLLSIHTPTAIATMPSGKSVEFVFTQVEDNSGVLPLYKVQWIRLVTEGQTTNYLSKFYPSTDGDIDFLKVKRFSRPEGVALDPSGNVFVVDAGLDSLFRFSSRGVERFSFGGRGSGDKQFDQPYGIAFFDKTIYVADRGNNRICRFTLSTDLR